MPMIITPDPTADLIRELSTRPEVDPRNTVRYALVSTHLEAMRPDEAAQWSTWCAQHEITPRRVPVRSMIIADDDARTVTFAAWDDHARLRAHTTQLEASARPFPSTPMPIGSMPRHKAHQQLQALMRDLDGPILPTTITPRMRDLLDRLNTGALTPPATPDAGSQIRSCDPR